MKKELLEEAVECWVEGPFFFGKYHTDIVDLETAQHAVESRHQLLKGESKLAIIDSGSAKKITKEARAYLSGPYSYEGLKATAILARSPLAAVMGNFYLRFGNFPIPTRMFKNVEGAKKWLLSLNL